jgi:Gluconate 2-dehydrogenase subunit 3
VSLQRREFFAILGIYAAGADELFAGHDHRVPEVLPAFTSYRPRALTESEYKLLDEFAETLLPADETGPGARDAHVAYYIDVVLYRGRSGTLQSWKSGLAHVEGLADERFQQRFAACNSSQRQEILAELLKNEMAPETEMERFFVELKRTLIDGFYASELIQHRHLGYEGNTAVAEFAGCTHANFEHPGIA